MPVRKIKQDGKTGYQFGEHGKRYFGPGAEEKAKRQGRAIEAEKHKKKK